MRTLPPGFLVTKNELFLKKNQNFITRVSIAGIIFLLISCNQSKPQKVEEIPSAAIDSVELISKWVPSMEPNPHPDAQWFRQAAFGLFPCWGLASGTPDGQGLDIWVYSGVDDHGWRPPGQISPEKMFERANIFNPTDYRPDRWMEAASAAGFPVPALASPWTIRSTRAFFASDALPRMLWMIAAYSGVTARTKCSMSRNSASRWLTRCCGTRFVQCDKTVENGCGQSVRPSKVGTANRSPLSPRGLS